MSKIEKILKKRLKFAENIPIYENIPKLARFTLPNIIKMPANRKKSTSIF
jgi:hypothetical protein